MRDVQISENKSVAALEECQRMLQREMKVFALSADVVRNSVKEAYGRCLWTVNGALEAKKEINSLLSI